MEKAALRLVVECGRTAAALLRYLLWPFLTGSEAGERGTRLTRKRPPKITRGVTARAA